VRFEAAGGMYILAKGIDEVECVIDYGRTM